VYADTIWRPSSRLEIVPGVRLDAYQARGRTAVAPQPRLSSRLRIGERLSWISALGMAHQEPTDAVFVPAHIPDRIDESPRDSYQYSEAIEARLPASLLFRGTVFATRIVGEEDSGEKRSEGVELFVRRDFSQRLAGFASYTLSRTDRTTDNVTVRSNGDRTHLLSLVVGYDLGNDWRLGGRFFFESGRPYAAACTAPQCPGGGGSDAPAVAWGNLPPFYRADVRLEHKWRFSGDRWLAATFECFNANLKSEPIDASYVPGRGVVVRYQSAVILPSIGLEGGL
jgi:hypothetical protein